MSMRTPPRSRISQVPSSKPAVLEYEYGHNRAFSIVIILVIIALIAIYIKGLTSPTTAATMSPGVLYNNLGITINPGKVKENSKSTPNASATPIPMANLPVISEIMAGNKGSIAAEDGKYYDWIEIYNPTSHTINLAGFALSDDPKKPLKFVLPNYLLDSGKYIIVFASGKTSTNTEIHANFRLKLSGKTIILTDPNGRQIQSVAYPPMRIDYSYAMDMNDPKNWTMTDKYTPGFPNTDEGYAACQQARHASSPIHINEVMAKNTMTIKDEDGNYSDWVEIYNPTDQAIDLTGWGLSNRGTEPKRWEFPAMKIEAKKYVMVFLSGKNRSVAGKELHANFRMNAYKDTILLSNFLGQIVSVVQISNQPPDESYGRVPGSDQWQLFTHPTPGYPNSEEGYNALQKK